MNGEKLCDRIDIIDQCKFIALATKEENIAQTGTKILEGRSSP